MELSAFKIILIRQGIRSHAHFFDLGRGKFYPAHFKAAEAAGQHAIPHIHLVFRHSFGRVHLATGQKHHRIWHNLVEASFNDCLQGFVVRDFRISR